MVEMKRAHVPEGTGRGWSHSRSILTDG